MKLTALALVLFTIAAAALIAAPPAGSDAKEAPKRTGKVYVQVYQKENFKGPVARVPVPAEVAGSAQLKAFYIANDGIMSLKIPEGVVVTLYDADGFQGASESFTGNVATVGRMKGQTSSMKTAFQEKKP
jgi:hypothetical protein